MNMGTLSPSPWDLSLWGKNGCFLLRPPGSRWSVLAIVDGVGATGVTRRRHSRPWVGARVASLRRPVLRPGAVSICRSVRHAKKNVANSTGAEV
jgi:hypothetical protein